MKTIIGVIPLVIGWIYNILPIVADLRGTTPRTVRQPYWSRDWIQGSLVHSMGYTMNEKGGSYDFKKTLTANFHRRRLLANDHCKG